MTQIFPLLKKLEESRKVTMNKKIEEKKKRWRWNLYLQITEILSFQLYNLLPKYNLQKKVTIAL